jgi:son of sevenless-like protein
LGYQVISQLESGWWDGVLGGVRGWFPSTYCTFVDPSSSFSEVEHNSDEDHSASDNESGQEHTLDDETNFSKKFWVFQATPEGNLFCFNTLTGVSTTELPFGATSWM